MVTFATVRAMVHSKQEVQKVLVLNDLPGNDTLVLLGNGTVCHAIFNPFTGLYYADDMYGVVSIKEEAG